MKLKKLCPLILTLASFAVFAAASPLTITFVSGNGTPVTGTTSPANEQVLYYPYVINVNGSNLTVACDDFFDHVAAGQTWSGVASTIGDLSQTLFYNGGAGVNLYKEAFWLFSQFQPAPPNANEVNAAINYAMWDLFDASAPVLNQVNGDPTTASNYWLNLANDQLNNGFTGFDFSRFVVYTPTSWTSDYRPQEFIGEVPEPATLALFGGGLLLLGFFFKRRLAHHDGDLSANA